jgi:dsDNA-binding SOS-regulon protein
MAVETKYVVVRKGEEKMSFASKKEADSWDKMLDLAGVVRRVAGRGASGAGRISARGIRSVAGGA